MPYVSPGPGGAAELTAHAQVVLPSYPTYNSHPVQWLPSVPASEGSSELGVEGKKDR